MNPFIKLCGCRDFKKKITLAESFLPSGDPPDNVILYQCNIEKYLHHYGLKLHPCNIRFLQHNTSESSHFRETCVALEKLHLS